MTVRTRFAPSPTGFLHIGGARTALFNYLFSRHEGGEFLLRIEDTDKKRSTQEAIDAIIDGLQWLGLRHDGPIVLQSRNLSRHQGAARRLLEIGAAYPCTCSADTLEAKRKEAEKKGGYVSYDRTCRTKTLQDVPAGTPYAIRLKAPLEGEVKIKDIVQGEVSVKTQQLDDMVLLRTDGTPTYMHAVVVDDHDMAITHVIRGDDHLNNTFRQKILYEAFGWEIPQFAHIPLIHGSDGQKLSKRHGALGVEEYRKRGYLPEALCNTLMRLSWSHGNDEVISMEDAIRWFSFRSVSRGAARLDFHKMNFLNAHYIKQYGLQNPVALLDLARPFAPFPLEDPLTQRRLLEALPLLAGRAQTLDQLFAGAAYFSAAYAPPKAPLKEDEIRILSLLQKAFKDAVRRNPWQEAPLKEAFEAAVAAAGFEKPVVFPLLRYVLTGGHGPSVNLFKIMEILGEQEVEKRFAAILSSESP